MSVGFSDNGGRLEPAIEGVCSNQRPTLFPPECCHGSYHPTKEEFVFALAQHLARDRPFTRFHQSIGSDWNSDLSRSIKRKF